jgi:Tn3 transposase DDE domain
LDDRRYGFEVAVVGSYSDIVFGLLRLLGFDYRPQVADLPDAKLWRIDADADYGPLSAAARARSTWDGCASTGRTCRASWLPSTSVR